MSAALLASFAGTAGTIIGAAVGSVVFTVGGATYTWSLRRTSEAALRRTAQVRQRALATTIRPRTVVDGPMRTDEDHEGPVERPSADSDHIAHAQDEPGRKLPWGRVLLASLALTVAVLGGITLVEAITGSPISSWLGRSDSKGTSVGNVVGSQNSAKKDSGTDSSPDSPTPSQAARPSSPAAKKPSATIPSTVPSPSPSQPAQPSASTAP